MLSTFIYRHFHDHDQQRFTVGSGILTGNDTGGAAQVAAAHCSNEWTLDPISSSISTAALWCDGQDEEAKEDYSHLPPNQQKKKLTEKIDTLKSSLAKHTAARLAVHFALIILTCLLYTSPSPRD